MEWSIVAEAALLTVMVAGIVVFGVLVFQGNERCFRLLAGGRDFLSLDPTEREYRRTARESGVAVFLVAFLLLCVWGGDIVGRMDAASPFASWAQAAIPALVALSMAGLIVIVVMQIRRHVHLLNRR